MKHLEQVNIGTACLVVAVLVLIFSPVADPTRLSVDNQVGRLRTGRVSAQAFDYDFLRFHSGRPGQAALARLISNPPQRDATLVVQKAMQAQARKYAFEPWPKSEPDRRKMYALPPGQALPADFVSQDWIAAENPFNGCESGTECAAMVVDLDGDGAPEVVTFQGVGRTVYGRRDGTWRRVGVLAGTTCGDEARQVRFGKATASLPSPAWRDVVIDGRSFRLVPESKCVTEKPR